MRVLITGAAGLIGGILRRSLVGHELAGIDIKPNDEFSLEVCDISDLSSIRSAFEGADSVVHLAAIASSTAPWDSIINNNIIGTYNVLRLQNKPELRGSCLLAQITLPVYTREIGLTQR
mgnify:CR=1 FL=1